MMKIAKVNAAVAPIGTSGTRFKYVLNDESTLEKLKRNALIPDLYVNRNNRDNSVSIQLNTGAYLSAVVPLVQFYRKNKGLEVDRRQTKGLELFIEDTAEQKDAKGTIVTNLIDLLVDGKHVKVSAYDTTGLVRVQGSGTQLYAEQLLIPRLEDDMTILTRQINKANETILNFGNVKTMTRAAKVARKMTSKKAEIEDVIEVLDDDDDDESDKNGPQAQRRSPMPASVFFESDEKAALLPPEPAQSLKCDECNFSFVAKEALDSHMTLTHETLTARTIDLRASQKLILPILNQDADTCSSDMSEDENEDNDCENWIPSKKQTDLEDIQHSLVSAVEFQPSTIEGGGHWLGATDPALASGLNQQKQHQLSNNDPAPASGLNQQKQHQLSNNDPALAPGLEGGPAPERTQGDSGAPLQEGCSGAPLSSRLNQHKQPPSAQPLDLSTAPRPADGRVVEDRRERNLKKYFKSKQITAEVEHQPDNVHKKVSICRTCHHSCTDDRRDQVAILQHQLQRLQETLNTQVGELKREVNVLQASLSQLRGATFPQHAKPVQANQIVTYASKTKPARPPIQPRSLSPLRKGKPFQPAIRPKGKVEIQLFGDSIATNLVEPKLEAASGSLLKKTKAYAAQVDQVARFKDKAVSKMIRKQRKPAHTAILGAPSVDITNQSTNGGITDENVATTAASAHAQIENAEYLVKAGLAQQVLVLEHIPRHDDGCQG